MSRRSPARLKPDVTRFTARLAALQNHPVGPVEAKIPGTVRTCSTSWRVTQIPLSHTEDTKFRIDGAGRSAVLRMVYQDVLRLLAWGLAAGLLASFALTRFLSHLLFEVRPTDLATSASVALLLAMVALLSCYAAMRAASIDPALALRFE